MHRLWSAVFLFLATLPGFAAAQEVSGTAIVREMNLARENPALYATYIEALRPHFEGNYLVRPGRLKVRTKEGVAAIDEAVRFLRKTRPMHPLNFSGGMSRAAADHCADQASGRTGHRGRNLSSPGSRISRYGTWGMTWGENISYGQRSAREIVIALIVDDGLRHRKHRKNIFQPAYNFAGAAYGPHAVYGSMCSIDFAGSYLERGQDLTQALVSAN